MPAYKGAAKEEQMTWLVAAKAVLGTTMTNKYDNHRKTMYL